MLKQKKVEYGENFLRKIFFSNIYSPIPNLTYIFHKKKAFCVKGFF